MDFQVLASRGQGGYRQYRIPALSVTKSGRLIAIYDARPDFDDLPAPIDLLIQTSDDSGNSWSQQSVFRGHESTSGFGDASIIVDPTFGSHGRIIVLYQFTQHAGFFESDFGTDLKNPNVSQIGRSISDDDGLTWKHDFITTQLKDDETEGIFATSGAGARIDCGEFSGRLLQTFVLRRGDQLLSAIGFSDNHGETWKLGALIPGGNETAIASLEDGSILIHSRSTPFRLTATSKDGGMTIESITPHKELPDPSDNGSLYRLTDGALICTHNHDQNLRRKTVIKRSRDGGKSWPEAGLLELGSSAYSTSCQLADGSIGILFERDAYNEITFCRMSLDEFKPVAGLSSEDLSEYGIEFTVVPRCIIPARNENLSRLLAKDVPQVPEADVWKFNPAARKEVGPAGGSTSGNPLFTSAEYDLLLGPVSPGLHVGDEVRVSGRLANHGKSTLRELEITHALSGLILRRDLLKPNEKELFLDVRQIVTPEDVQSGFLTINCNYLAMIEKTAESEKKQISGYSSISISVETGLEIKSQQRPEG